MSRNSISVIFISILVCLNTFPFACAGEVVVNVPYFLSRTKENFPAVVVNVKVSDNDIQNGLAFVEALRTAKHILKSGKKKVYIDLPVGEFTLSQVIFLDVSGLGIRGAGQDKTRIKFSKSIRESLDYRLYMFNKEEMSPERAEKIRQAYGSLAPKASEWSFRGGLIWIQANPFELDDALQPSAIISGQYPERAVSVSVSASQAHVMEKYIGKYIHLRWKGGRDLLKIIYGHDATFDKIECDKWILLDEDREISYFDARRVVDVRDNKIIFDAPLRLPIDSSKYSVTMQQLSGTLEDISIENVSIVMPQHYRDPTGRDYIHLHEPGYNGFFIQNAISSTIRNISFINCDLAIGMELAYRSCVDNISIESRGLHKGHHGITLRYCANDNLISNFKIISPMYHGLSFQDLASGNIAYKGCFSSGTIECHRGMPFDNIRYDMIFERCDGRGGGMSGPYCGRRTVTAKQAFLSPPPAYPTHKWHSGAGLVLDPRLYPMGIIADIKGLEQKEYTENPWAMPPGLKGAIVDYANEIKVENYLKNVKDIGEK
jgi:hypothetical protein